MREIIVYYSMSGNTDYTAGKIAEIRGADLLRIYPVRAYPDKGFIKFLWGGRSAVMAESPKLRPYEFEPDRYDRVVIGFPIWAGTFAPPIRTFVKENAEALKTKDIAVFACMGGSSAEKAFIKLGGLLGKSSFGAQLVLTDPLEHMDEADIEKIKEFCSALD